MNADVQSRDIKLEPADNDRLAALCGQFDSHLRQLEQRLGVEINSRGNRFRIIGEDAAVQRASEVLASLYAETASAALTPGKIHLYLQESADSSAPDAGDRDTDTVVIKTPGGVITPRGRNQKHYLRSIVANDLNFGIGPAGTGKTYLAVACAVQALEQEKVSRLVLVRPAVEAGERLGFLPGDMTQKVDPYLRPLYDALYEMLGIDKVARLIERSVIEVAPLAFMRGRSLNDAFIILDEGQNTTVEQMKMFLTRIGFGSTAVVTGDITQVDLPKHTESGLRQVIDVLKDSKGISFSFFSSQDVVRHPLVQRVISAYEDYERLSGKS
ncbi:MAG TPA: PhoH family protein [Gammaproteobacteria bacterium]|nr:PhoH family protein [Gammaproteobacteria bacterium]